MSRDFYKNEEIEEKENKYDYSENETKERYKEKKETGQIKGKISVAEVIDKNKIFIAIGVVGFLLLIILLFNGGKKEKKTEEYTLGNPGGFKVEAGKNQDGTKSEDDLSDEEKKELEKLSQSQNEQGNDTGEISKKVPEFNNNQESNQYYNDDPVYKNSGEFQNINANSDGSEVIEDREETKTKEKRDSPIFFKSKTETVSSSNNNEIPSGIISGQQNGQQTFVDNDQNRQESKRKFLETKRTESFYSNNFVTPSLSKYEIKTGTLIPGILVTEINSDLPGNILGQVSSNIYSSDGKKILIPMGTKIIGKYDSSLAYGQNRVLIVWERLIFPNKSTLELDNLPGTDLLGRAGMTGKVNYHGWQVLRSVVLSSLLGATTSGLSSLQFKADNKGNRSVSIGSNAAEEAKNSLNQAVSSLVERDLDRQPTVKIKQGSRFNIFVTKDMIVTPYKKSR